MIAPRELEPFHGHDLRFALRPLRPWQTDIGVRGQALDEPGEHGRELGRAIVFRRVDLQPFAAGLTLVTVVARR